MKILFLTIFAYLTLPYMAEWSTDYEKAKTEAQQSKKYILLNFSGSDWCVPCIKMKKEIFESEIFNGYAPENLVLLKADFPRLKKNKLSTAQKKQNEMLAEKYNPQGTFPFTLLLDANGGVLKTWNGMPKVSASAFVSELKQVKNGNK
jgi:thioredoxin-related protein